jgi:hypothetical protein
MKFLTYPRILLPDIAQCPFPSYIPELDNTLIFNWDGQLSARHQAANVIISVWLISPLAAKAAVKVIAATIRERFRRIIQKNNISFE